MQLTNWNSLNFCKDSQLDLEEVYWVLDGFFLLSIHSKVPFPFPSCDVSKYLQEMFLQDLEEKISH